MMALGQQGLGVLVALMIARGAAGQAPPQQESVQAPHPVLIAASESDSARAGKAQSAVSPEGAFKRLPAGEQRVARALLEAEQVGPDSAPAWSLDRIAAAKESGKGWEGIVREMQGQSLIAAGEPERVLEGAKGAPRALARRDGDAEELSADLATASGPGPKGTGEKIAIERATGCSTESAAALTQLKAEAFPR